MNEILIVARDAFGKQGDVQGLQIAAILSTLCGSLKDTGGNNIERIADFCCSISRESIVRLKKEIG